MTATFWPGITPVRRKPGWRSSSFDTGASPVDRTGLGQTGCPQLGVMNGHQQDPVLHDVGLRAKRNVADLVDDQQRDPLEAVELLVEAALALGVGQQRDPFGRRPERDAVPGNAGAVVRWITLGIRSPSSAGNSPSGYEAWALRNSLCRPFWRPAATGEALPFSDLIDPRT